MSWVRFGDELPDWPEILALGDDEAVGGWTYVRCVSYAGRHLTDGELPAGFLRREDPRGVTALVRVGLVEQRLDGSGFLPRFLEVRDSTGRVVSGHHPSRVDVEARRQRRAGAGKAGGIASGEARRQAPEQAGSQAAREAIASQDAEQEVNPGPVPVPGPLPDPHPARTARANGHDRGAAVFDEMERRGIRVDRSNGHAEMVRGMVDRHGERAVLDELVDVEGVTSFRQAAFGLQDRLEPPTSASRPEKRAKRNGRTYEDIVITDAKRELVADMAFDQ